MKKIVFMGFLLFLGLSSTLGQTIRISGMVTDAQTGDPVPLASILVKGTTDGAIAEFDGRFSLQAAANATLVVSAVGYVTQEIAVAGRSVVNVVLNSDVRSLEEFVITGLGAATDRRRVAISVETVGEEQLQRIPSTSLDNALIGRIAGANISSTSGQPGQQANIILRGINTLGTTQPMILIDGVEVSGSGNAIGTGNVSSRLSDLDLSNVERIEVVQGAAAATIYGAQGANGVIHIFTKRGRKGQKTDVSFATTYSLDNALRGNLSLAKFHHYNTNAAGLLVDAAGNLSVQNPVTGLWNMPHTVLTANTVNNKVFANPTYDNLGSYFKKNAGTLLSNINVVGASSNIDFAFGLSALSQESVVHGDLNRYNFTANIGSEIFKNFTIRSNSQLISSTNTTGGINNRNNIFSGISGAIMVPQFVDISWVNANGHPAVIHDPSSNAVAPFYSYMYQTYEADLNRVIQGLNLNYKPIRQLEIDYRFGVDHYRYNYETFIKNQTQAPAPQFGITPLTGQLLRRRINETQLNSILSAILRLDFEKDFDLGFPLQTTTQVAYDWRQNDYHSIDAIGTVFDVAPPHTLNFAGTTDANEYLSKFITFGYLVNQRFDFGLIGGFSVGFRTDYSSEFGEGGAKPFTFPRADAYLRLSEFLKRDFIGELKLRAAYGEAGIQPGRYARQITIAADVLGTAAYTYLPAVSRNPLLDVENTREFEVGLDYGIFLTNTPWINKASGSLVYWTRNSFGTIYGVDVAPSTGAAGLLTNAIDLASNGIQLSLDLSVYNTRNTKWNFGVRFTKGETMVDRISNGQPIVVGSAGSGQTVIMEGHRVGALFGRKARTSLDQTNSAGVPYILPENYNQFEIVNGMVVNKATKNVQFTSEQFTIGDATPDFSMSFFNDFTLFRDLNISVQLDWVQGAQAYNQSRQWLYRDRLHSDFDKEVTIDGQTGAFVAYWNSMYQTNRTNDFFVEDASFLRLRSLGVSYDFGRVLKQNFVKGLVLGFSARNLFTITNYTGLDPETAATNLNDPLSRGTDLWSFPNMRTFNFSLNVKF